MQERIPKPGHRVTLEHDSSLEEGSEASFEHDSSLEEGSEASFEQGQAQNKQIVSYAREVGGIERFVAVEVFYNRSDGTSSSEDDFDAVIVDTTKGYVVKTTAPYDEIDPEWRVKRNG